MLTDTELAGMRTTSASALPDRCTITRPGTGQPIFDPISGTYTAPAPVTVYTGPCRVRPAVNVEQDVQVGEMHETLGRYTATLPATLAIAQQLNSTATGDPNTVRVDDFLTVTTSSDPALVSRSMRIVHVNVGAWQIDRRMILEDQEQR